MSSKGEWEEICEENGDCEIGKIMKGLPDDEAGKVRKKG